MLFLFYFRGRVSSFKKIIMEFLREKIVPQVLSFPLCNAWARYMPNVSIFGFPLNPGPFTIKEHVIITIMANVGASTAYAVSVAPNHVSAVPFSPRSYNPL